MKFNGSNIRSAAGWLWNLGIVVLAMLTVLMFARRPADQSDDKIAAVCRGLEQGADQASIQKCIEDMKR
ncbi:MAG: hypothetical protein JOY67_07630 [Hyphomicrobiales bacterium]|nr:hypothetical protein [Hyphomicrobiales bacterium]MBV9112677.1 hypothetical protein [Hyphomicrobiales bacterium]MBV9520578.1 hypothetical protein [Hyphomicrobiales bacterium]